MKNKYRVYSGLAVLILSCTAPKVLEDQNSAPVNQAENDTVLIMEQTPVPDREPAEQAEETADEPVFFEPQKEPKPEIFRLEFPDFIFKPDPVISLTVPPGTGNVTRENREQAMFLTNNEITILSQCFRDAYIDGLLRNQSLAGVLGGDQVHAWPRTNPLSWVQNWATSEPKPNSWGLPSLILAIRDREITRENEQCRVFTVQGDILDFYGTGSGINGANGSAGFGSPCTQEFFFRNYMAQRFDYGLIFIDENGRGTFLEEPVPSDEFTGYFGEFISGEPADYEAQKAMITAWRMAMNSGMAGGQILVPDGSMQYISFFGNDLWQLIPGVRARGFYIITFNQKTAALVLPDTSSSPITAGLPFHARFLGSKFLELLCTGLPLDGTEEPLPLNLAVYEDDFIVSLMEGFAVYGLPLTDPVYRILENDSADGFTRITEQRFSRGWISYEK